MTKQGINIFSGTKGLGGKLTNMTELAYRKGSIDTHYPMTFRFLTYQDAEAAYQRLKLPNRYEDNQLLMIEIIVSKFQQYPQLRRAIKKQGGGEWLKKCWHTTSARNPMWEGNGLESAFIRCLYLAYLFVNFGEE